MGLPKFLAYLFLHATACGLRRTSSPSPFAGDSCCLRDPLDPRHPQQTLFRSCTSTSGDAVPPTAYRILCLRFTCLVRRYHHRLRLRRKTRYGWVANPFQAGTFTLKDKPSFAWRETARAVTRPGSFLARSASTGLVKHSSSLQSYIGASTSCTYEGACFAIL
jgi:hypothetical protein